MEITSNKYRVVFYEKTGCAGNKRQKELLMKNGISFETKSLLDTVWDYSSLNSFFENLKKEEMINQFAPQIKNELLDIDSLSKEELVELMCENPILIKRPLLEIGNTKICGFDIEKVNQLLNSDICESVQISTCLSSDSCVSV